MVCLLNIGVLEHQAVLEQQAVPVEMEMGILSRFIWLDVFLYEAMGVFGYACGEYGQNCMLT